MEKLETFIKEVNLIPTGTMDKYEFASPNFNLKEKLVEYKNCISLYKLISNFNEQYNAFLKDYNELEKIEKYEKAAKIIYRSSTNYDYKDLMLYIPSLPTNKDVINLSEEKGLLYSVALGPIDKPNPRIDLNLKASVIKGYLDLFEKYKELLSQYNFLQNQCIFGDGTTGLYSEIKGYFLKGLNKFNVSFGNTYFLSEDFVTISTNLGNNLSIDWKESKIELDTKEVEVTEEATEKLLKKTYINKDIIQERKKSFER